MPARKSKHSREALANRDRYARPRVFQEVPTKRVIVVVCDDAKTSVGYFTCLKQLVRKRTALHVERSPHDRATAQEVVESAIEHRNRLLEEGVHDNDDHECVWALVDLEWDSERRAAAHQAKSFGVGQGIHVALSDPCYEVWTLLHLDGTGEMFMNCAAALARVETEWQKAFAQAFGPKAHADYGKIMPRIGEAIARAKKNYGANPRTPSWTEVFQALEAILGAE